MKIFTKEQFAEHNKKLLAEKEKVSSEEESKGIEKGVEKVIEFFQDMEDVKEDIEELETELERKANTDHTHKEFQELNEKIEEKTNLINNLSYEIKETKSSIKHYDDKPVLEQLKAIDEKVNGIVIPEVDLSGFLKEKNIKNLVDKKEIESLANKDEVYNKEETYNKDEVYTKKEVYNKKEIDERIKNNQGGSTSIVGGASFMGDLQDVKLSNTEDGQILVYDEVTKRWENATAGSSVNKLLELVGKDCTLTYNGSNQVLTQTYIDGTVTTNTYTSGVITQTSTIFPDETTITVTYNYTGGLVSSIEYN